MTKNKKLLNYIVKFLKLKQGCCFLCLMFKQCCRCSIALLFKVQIFLVVYFSYVYLRIVKLLYEYMARHNLLGNKGEMLASRYLLDSGLAVLEYNWRCGHKEIDIIAQERDVLVFVEVKTRTSEAYGNAEDAVTPEKMRRIIMAAESYIKQKKIDLDIRFDVVTVVGSGDCHKIEHIRNAFYPTLDLL